MNREFDFDLCSVVAARIAKEFGGGTQAGAYPENERVVVVVWTATGIIENGGFHYLFESVLPGDPELTHTITAFKRIGCLEAGETVQKAVNLFPGSIPQRSDVERIRWFESQNEEVRNSLDNEFWNELDKITTCLAKYIRNVKLDKLYYFLSS